MNASLRVSVVVPVFNGEGFLADAIDSVLAQTAPVTEIVVVDDGSTDATVTVAARYGERIRLLRQSNQGVSAARNHGIRASRSELLTFLDADDRFEPNALELHLERFERHADVGIVLGQFRDFSGDAPSRSDNATAGRAADEQLFTSFGCALIRRAVFDTVGLLREDLRLAEDWDWFTRAREADVRFLIHRNVVLNRRLHGNNLTRQREAGQKFVFETLRRSLARRRSDANPPTPLAPLSSFLEPEGESP